MGMKIDQIKSVCINRKKKPSLKYKFETLLFAQITQAE